jgi:hypothetical protein
MTDTGFCAKPMDIGISIKTTNSINELRFILTFLDWYPSKTLFTSQLPPGFLQAGGGLNRDHGDYEPNFLSISF